MPARPVPSTVVVLLLAALVAGAGCAGPSAPPEEPAFQDASSGGAGAAAADPSTLPPAAVAAAGPDLLLDGCVGITTFAYVVSGAIGLTPPEGWSMGAAPVNELRVEAYVCQRVSIGPFERGPVGLLMEFFGLADGPAACLEGDYNTLETPTGVWTTDPEITAHLQTLGLPAANAAIRAAEEGLVPDAIHWSFSEPGRFEATLDPSVGPAPAEVVTPHVYRMVWVNLAGGLTRMDLDLKTTSDAYAPHVVTGRLPEPFLYSRLGTDAYVGYGSALSAASGHGTIEAFADLGCESPT